MKIRVTNAFLIPFITLVVTLVFTAKLFAGPPSVLDPNSDREYRETLQHLKQMLPEVESKAVYSVLMRPYGLLDIHATQFASQEDKAKFANFNLGVMASLLHLSQSDLARIPQSLLCSNDTCIDERTQKASEFLVAAQTSLNTMAQSGEISVVGQLSDNLYRINNTFVSGSKAYSYSSSEVAGFVPSSKFTLYEKISDAPNLQAHMNKIAELLKVMKEFNVAAVVRSSKNTLDIIFNGAGDNYWGVVLGDKSLTIPKEGDFNHLGYRYDKISVIQDNVFYYQTD